jgi:hypothetical protein
MIRRMGYSAELTEDGELVVGARWDDGRSSVERWQARWSERAYRLAVDAPADLRQAHRVAGRQGFVLTTGQARAAGLDSARLRSLIRRKVWWTPRRGIVVVLRADDDSVIATLTATAAALARPGSVISHASAAVLHGLPTIATEEQHPVLTIGPRHAQGKSSIELHRAQLGADEVSLWYGTPITSVARTVIDLARGERGAGLVAADAAIREGLVRPAALWATATRWAGWPGAASARWVAEHADGLAESPLESLTRECLLVGGLPPAQLQGEISDGTGWRARLDLLWRDRRVIVEADGRVKYRENQDALWREKRRQERLEQLGFRVVRVSWQEVVHEPTRTVQRVRSALERSN